VPDGDPILDKTPHSVRRLLSDNFELISVVVMSVTAIATAWSGFQARNGLRPRQQLGDAASDQTE
jgi:hypothetical protein